ncbi:MAG: response regulator, partial [Bacteroidota bacterium]
MQKVMDYKILVADDDPDILRITEHLLKKEGYTVRTAANGRECLHAIHENKPDLLLLDVILPDISGVDICQTIKRDPGFSQVYILLHSGMNTKSEEISEGLEHGADGYLVKPVSNRELLARVEAACRIIRAERTLSEL